MKFHSTRGGQCAKQNKDRATVLRNIRRSNSCHRPNTTGMMANEDSGTDDMHYDSRNTASDDEIAHDDRYDDDDDAGFNNNLKMAGLNLRDREKTRKMPYYEHVRKERVAIQSMTKPLKMWLYRNKAHPYPTKADKMELAGQTKMTFTQVNNWFANARRRLKNTVKHPDLAWDERIRMYNSHVSANAELLSVHSEEGVGCTRERLQEEERRRCEAAAHAVAEAAAGCLVRNVPESDNYNHHIYNRRTDMHAAGAFGPMKFKHTILQRYLNDTIKYGNSSSHYPEHPGYLNSDSGTMPGGSRWGYKQRLMSGSSGGEETPSDDCMSPNPRSPSSHHHLWSEELRELQEFVSRSTDTRHTTPNPRYRSLYHGLNAKELSAVMALTDLALGTAN